MYISILFVHYMLVLLNFPPVFREIDFKTELLDFSPSKYIYLR